MNFRRDKSVYDVTQSLRQAQGFGALLIELLAHGDNLPGGI